MEREERGKVRKEKEKKKKIKEFDIIKNTNGVREVVRGQISESKGSLSGGLESILVVRSSHRQVLQQLVLQVLGGNTFAVLVLHLGEERRG